MVSKVRDYLIKREKILILFILIFGILIRIYSIELGYASNHFSKIDEVDAYEYGVNLFYFSHQRVLFRNPGPYQNLIVYLLIKVFNSVKALNYFMILVYIISFFLLRKLCFTFFSNFDSEKGKIIGLFSILFYSFSPWCVKYSNSFWNPYFVIPIITWFYISLYNFLYNGKEREIFGVILSLAIMPFFHMIVIFCVATLFILIILRIIKPDLFYSNLEQVPKLKFNLLYFIFAIFISIIIYLPMLYMDYKNDFFLIKNYLFFLFRNSDALTYAKMLDGINFNSKGFTYVFHPEVFKIFSNPIIVMTNEISRFTGHTFNEYKYFLNRAFLFYPIGFLFILPSFILVLVSYYYFFKDFFLFLRRNKIKSNENKNKRNYKNIKNITINEFDKNILDKDIKIKVFISSIILINIILFILSGFPHEERFTVIWFPLLIIIISNFLYDTFFENKINFNFLINFIQNVKNKTKSLKFKNILEAKIKYINFVFISLFLFNLLTGIYLNFQHYRTERTPSVNSLTRLVPSLIFYEKVKYSIFNHYFIYIEKENERERLLKMNIPYVPIRSIIPEDYIHYFDKIFVKDRWKSFSFFYFNQIINENVNFNLKENFEDNKNYEYENLTGKPYFLIKYLKNPKYKYYLSKDYLWLNWNLNREVIILDLLKRFININSDLITDDKDKADFIIYFVTKKYYIKQKDIFNYFDKIGEFADFYILCEKVR